MPRPKGSKNKVKNLKGRTAADYAAALAEKNAEKDQLNGEISAINAQIAELKDQLKAKKAAVKSTDKVIAKLQEKQAAFRNSSPAASVFRKSWKNCSNFLDF